ncbi:hypothetical protein [Microbacterium trichothecenolyticum]|uniref:hypothetical protein n=1 Tax=Microbacterium trichothecenolyticum TaxID=69370 RepID=UPI0027E30F91|nr:hypothetical protein [Microbacterium trichothecenolyticum]
MEIATSQLPRIVRLALIGAGAAFAWIVVSLVLGIGLGQAHADEADDAGVLGGALGGVTSLVDATASTGTGTVSTASTGVAETVNTVVAAVPAPVGQPVSQIAQTVGTVVTTVTQPVTEAVSGGVVNDIAAPVVDLVTEVPVVGGIVSDTGLDDAVTDLGGTVDETLGELVGAVGETGATIGQPPATGPGIPVRPVIPQLPGLLGSPADSSAPNAIALLASQTDAAATLFTTTARAFGHWAAASVSETATRAAVVVSSAALVAGGLLGSAGGLCLSISSAGPGGAGPGAWALAALLPLAAHRAWVRRAGPDDEHAPPAPAGSTDVSPD